MSRKNPSVIDYFDLNGDLIEESEEYADILYAEGIRTILFKCRQRKDLTRFISRVLKLANGEPSNIHPDFRA